MIPWTPSLHYALISAHAEANRSILGFNFKNRGDKCGEVYTVYIVTTRDRIFAFTKARFDAEGLPGVSMRRIAGDVGITPMAIYRHYPDKEALLNALMVDGFAAWEARARAITTKDPLLWLERLGNAFADFALADPRSFEAAFLLPASQARRYPDDFAAGRSPVINLVYARIEEAKNQGKICDAPAAEIALSFAALAQGLVSMYRAGRFAGEAEFRTAYRSAIRHCLHSFLKGQTR
jgi:AcrR family transcriptional regulator